jgi:biotin carboxyl carrier protein
VTIDGQRFEIEVQALRPNGADFVAVVDGVTVDASVLDPNHLEWMMIGNRPYEVLIDRDLHWINSHAGRHQLEIRDLDAAAGPALAVEGRIKAPIPGLITRVFVRPGAQVEAGQPLMILEAMKMENEIRAPKAGILRQLNVEPGASVALNALLAEVG